MMLSQIPNKRYLPNNTEMLIMKEREMDWYNCKNTQGSGEGYVEKGEHPDNYTAVGCNCGGPHDWIYEGTWITDFDKHPWEKFYIG